MPVLLPAAAAAAKSSLWPSIISAGGSLLGGLLGDRGQKDANKQNLKIAREQMAFQERMSNSAYQRAAKDLSAAGLNRILALGSPASTPSGAMATMLSTTAGKADALKTGTASALQAKIAAEQFQNLQADTQNKATTNSLIAQQTLKEAEQTRINSAQANLLERTDKALGAVDPGINTIVDDFIPSLPGTGSDIGTALAEGWAKVKHNTELTYSEWKKGFLQRRKQASEKWNRNHVRP